MPDITLWASNRFQRLWRPLSVAVLVVTLRSACGAADFRARAESDYRSARENWRKSPSNNTAAVTLAKMAFNFAEFSTNDDQRAELAQAGIEAARSAIAREENNAAAHYWLGMDLSELARTKSLGALPLIKEIAREFSRAREIDEKVDFGGADRSLGLLYRDAPGWPASIGDHKKARQHLEHAIAINPDFPENQLCLLETYEKWGERNNFDRQLVVAERVMTEAHTKFTGTEWESNWADWQKRFDKMKRKALVVGRATHPKGAR